MAKKTINLGSTPDGKGGDDIRGAFTKTNENFIELYRDKVSAEDGKQLSDENYTLAEKDKLAGIAAEATKNRDDSENADKDHAHEIEQVNGLSAALLEKLDKTDVVQSSGQSTEKVMSQKAVTEMFNNLIPWVGSTIPSSGIVFDFEKNRYAVKGVPVGLSGISEFIRLSSATKWQDGNLVEVQDNVPRISNEGLLIEPQRTNSLHYSSDIRKWGNKGIASVDYSSSVGINGESLLTATNREFGSGVYARSYREAEETYSLSFQAKPNNWSKIAVAAGSSVVGNSLHVATINPVTDLETGTSPDHTSISPLLDGWSSVSRLYVSSPTTSQYNNGISLLFSDEESKVVPDGSSVYMRNAQAEKLPSGDSIGTSYIPTDGAPATRAPDTLVVPLLSTQSITGDWDEGVTYETVDNTAVFTGHGYIRNITVEAL